MPRFLLLGLLLLPLFSHAAEKPKVPAEKELKTLALQSLLAFDQAVQARDFAGFHKQISKLWQEQITPDKLKTTFQSFIDQEVDLSSVAGVEPTFGEPSKIDGNGVLTLQGNYPTSPRVEFRLRYVLEASAWKLAGIKLDVKPGSSAEAKLPSEEETRALVKSSLLAFNRAVKTKSFATFHEEIAELWQKQTTPEKLETLFQSFMDVEADISSIARLEPAFDPAPLIDADGLLLLHGSYPTKPNKVHFRLGYLFEAPEWRLIKINVRLDHPEDEPDEE